MVRRLRPGHGQLCRPACDRDDDDAVFRRFAFAIGAVVWLLAAVLVVRGASRFTRDRIAGQ